MNKFSGTLRDWLKAYDLSGTDLANQIGGSRSAVSNWLNGHSTPNMRSMEQLNRIFNIPDTDTFLNGPESWLSVPWPHKRITCINGQVTCGDKLHRLNTSRTIDVGPLFIEFLQALYPLVNAGVPHGWVACEAIGMREEEALMQSKTLTLEQLLRIVSFSNIEPCDLPLRVSACDEVTTALQRCNWRPQKGGNLMVFLRESLDEHFGRAPFSLYAPRDNLATESREWLSKLDYSVREELVGKLRECHNTLLEHLQQRQANAIFSHVLFHTYLVSPSSTLLGLYEEVLKHALEKPTEFAKVNSDMYEMTVEQHDLVMGIILRGDWDQLRDWYRREHAIGLAGSILDLANMQRTSVAAP